MPPAASIFNAPPAIAATARATRPLTPSFLALIAAIATTWLVLWFAGLPFPNGDDPFFAGAAIHLADTGQLANPWIVNWMHRITDVHADRFYVHPPFASYLLAAWLKLFGVSAASTSAYSCVVGALAASAAAVLLRQLRASIPAATLAALLVSVYLLHRGLRPEVPGIALLLAGQVLMTNRGNRFFFAGSVLTIASPFCHAFMLTLAGPALLLHLWVARGGPRHCGVFLARLRLMVFAAVVVLLLFLAAIRGELGAFINDFLGCAAQVRPPAGRIARFLEQLTIGWTFFPHLLALGSAASLVSWRLLAAPAERPTIALGLAIYTAMVGSGIFLYAPFAAVYAVMNACFLLLIWSPYLSGISRRAALVPALVFALWGLLEHSLDYTINRRAAPNDVAAIRQYVEQAKPTVVLFDASSLRYVFDFNPPPNAHDSAWCWAPGMSARWWSIDAMEDRDLWVVQPRPELKGAAAKLRPQPPRLFGRAFTSLQPADELIVIAGRAPAEPPTAFPFVAVRNHPAD
jgi:hypothetical protein